MPMLTWAAAGAAAHASIESTISPKYSLRINILLLASERLGPEEAHVGLDISGPQAIARRPDCLYDTAQSPSVPWGTLGRISPSPGVLTTIGNHMGICAIADPSRETA